MEQAALIRLQLALQLHRHLRFLGVGFRHIIADEDTLPYPLLRQGVSGDRAELAGA